MNKYIPSMYKKSIFDINYNILKNKGITSLIFDLDNTLLEKKKNVLNDETINLLNRLKNDFKIFIMSNNINKKRVSKASVNTSIPFLYFSLKPLSLGFKRIKRKYGISYSEMCIIGDQLLTDIYGGNKLKIYTVLVDPINSKELCVTSINRYIERKIIKKLSKLGLFERGKYYE